MNISILGTGNMATGLFAKAGHTVNIALAYRLGLGTDIAPAWQRAV